MEAKIFLSEEDRKELVELYKRAQHTPVIGFSCQQMLEGKDLASLSWTDVRNKMAELGKKYGFDPTKMKGIASETGEVFV